MADALSIKQGKKYLLINVIVNTECLCFNTVDMNESPTKDQIEDFLKLFNSDSEVAIRAIRELHENNQNKTNTQRPNSSQLLIEVQSLQKQYKIGRQKINALNDVSLEVGGGEFLAITGSSGSGKSTLLQLMGGLDKPTSGSVTINATNLNEMSDAKLSEFRGQTIGFVFQFFYLQPFLRLERNLEVPGMFARKSNIERGQRLQELADSVGIKDRLKHYPKEMSGGQIQRAAIARALMNNPKVILADEPTGNLDSQNAAGIINLFETIRKELGTTIVIATHDHAIAKRADRVMTIKDGQIL